MLVAPSALPGFWVFLYRVSPFTYLIQSLLATAVGNSEVTCASNEYLHITPPVGQTCSEFMAPYVSAKGGYILDTNGCTYCRLKDTNVFLASVGTSPSDSWRNFGLLWVYIIFNFFGAIFFYWLGRVPKSWSSREKEHVTVSPGPPTPVEGKTTGARSMTDQSDQSGTTGANTPEKTAAA